MPWCVGKGRLLRSYDSVGVAKEQSVCEHPCYAVLCFYMHPRKTCEWVCPVYHCWIKTLIFLFYHWSDNFQNNVDRLLDIVYKVDDLLYIIQPFLVLFLIQLTLVWNTCNDNGRLVKLITSTNITLKNLSEILV